MFVHSLAPRVLNFFSCSTQLSMKFQLLLGVEIAKIIGIFRFESPKPVIYPANKCLNANNCWHFNKINEQDKFYAQLSWASKSIPGWNFGLPLILIFLCSKNLKTVKKSWLSSVFIAASRNFLDETVSVIPELLMNLKQKQKLAIAWKTHTKSLDFVHS